MGRIERMGWFWVVGPDDMYDCVQHGLPTVEV